MKLSLSQIETFYWVARLKSLHAASRQQHLAQPTVSARIHELECTVGYKLFERHAQGTELTPRGLAFLKKAETLLDLADNILTDEAMPLRGLLRIGSNESAALAGLGAFLATLGERYPELNVELTVDVGSMLRSRINAGGLDFAILTNPSEHPQVRDVLLGDSDMCWVSAKGKLKQKAPFSPADLARLPILSVPAPSSLHALTMGWFASSRVSPPNINTCNSLAVTLQMVVSGIAIAILPRAIVQRELDDGTIDLLQVTRPVPSLPIYASFPVMGDTRVFEDIAELAGTVLLASGLTR